MSRVVRRAFAAAAGTLAMAASSAVMIAGPQVAARPVFTAQQATAGKGAYAKNCASCHMPDLTGNNEIPALTGTAFKEAWGARSTKELFDYMSAAMPYGGPSLSVDTYTSITAYILEFNGAVGGERELTAATAVPIGSLTPARATPPLH